MKSLRTKLTLFTICTIILVVLSMTVLSIIFIRTNEKQRSNQLLLLLCETGERNLDYYFDSVQKSVRNVAEYVEADLDGLEDEQLERHMERVAKKFDEMASRTNGVLTYYYRVDPAVSDKVSGFWYTDLDGEDFVEHEVTDITLYDTEDTSKLVWFTVPKYKGEPVWLPPYITDNLGKRVISYNVPIFFRGRFVGVVGIEIDYTTMAEQVESIRLYNNGYAFLSDADGNIFFHPKMDVSQLTEETKPVLPYDALAGNTFIRYTYDGVEKIAVWLPLSNGMRLNMAVPVSETEGELERLVGNYLVYVAIVLLAASVLTVFHTRRLTKPLEQLAEAAEQIDKGNYDYSLNYDGDDEVGRLTNVLKRLSSHMKDHIFDLNKQVYVDALTSVRNKGAYNGYIEEMQKRMDEAGGRDMAFAVGVFDCDNMKRINDRYGREKGDVCLKTASRLICRVFQHSPVFRIGGDEFSVILQNADYQNREALVRQFREKMAVINASARNEWEQAHIAMGIAEYEPQRDRGVNDVIRRADESMYENKRDRKVGM